MMRSRSRKRQSFPLLLLANSPRKRLEPQSAVDQSLFESAEGPAMQPKENSRSSPRSPAGSQTLRLQGRLALAEPGEQSYSTRLGSLMPAKIPACQLGRRSTLCHESGAGSCQQAPET